MLASAFWFLGHLGGAYMGMLQGGAIAWSNPTSDHNLIKIPKVCIKFGIALHMTHAHVANKVPLY